MIEGSFAKAQIGVRRLYQYSMGEAISKSKIGSRDARIQFTLTYCYNVVQLELQTERSDSAESKGMTVENMDCQEAVYNFKRR